MQAKCRPNMMGGQKPGADPGGQTKRSVVNKVLTLVGGRASGNVLTLLYTFILARVAAPEEFGLVLAGFAWAMLLSIGLALNIEAGSIKYLVRYRQTGQPGHVAGFLRFNLNTILILSLLLSAASLAVWAAGLVDATSPAVQVFAIAVVATPVVALTRVYGRHATALGQVLRGGLPIMFVRPAVICVLLIAVWLGGGQPGVVVLMLLMVVAFVVTALLQAFLLRKTFSFAKQAKPDFSDARQWLSTGVAMAPLLLMRDNLKHVVVASAGLTAGLADVGYVGLGFSIMSLVYFSVKAVDIALSPQLSHALQSKASDRVMRTLRHATTLKMIVLVIGTVGAVFFGIYGLGIFGPKYKAAFEPMLIMMLIPAADGFFGASQIVLNVTGRQSLIFWSVGISSVLLVGAVALGAWFFGATGAAAGASISYLAQQVMLWRLCRLSTGVETSLWCLWRGPPKLQ
jgi:O-antigen/teichoic acid export membrane protein